MQTHRICLPVPLYHCIGCVLGVISAANHGAACVLPSPAFSARRTIKAAAQEKYGFALYWLLPCKDYI